MPLLFSYGMLQQENVQMAVFGRLLDGKKDELLGFEHNVIDVYPRAVSKGADWKLFSASR